MNHIYLRSTKGVCFNFTLACARFFCLLFRIVFCTIAPNNAESVEDSCKAVKMESHTLIAPDSNGSPVIGSEVIVLNPVTDSVCSLQCAVGWYESVYGNRAPFLCAPKTTNRTSREGIPTYPINCASALFLLRYILSRISVLVCVEKYTG